MIPAKEIDGELWIKASDLHQAVNDANCEWVGLTDREKSNLWLESRAAIPRFQTYATLIEAKLKEKNA